MSQSFQFPNDNTTEYNGASDLFCSLGFIPRKQNYNSKVTISNLNHGVKVKYTPKQISSNKGQATRKYQVTNYKGQI